MQISAFVDGELPDAEADLLLRRMSQDVELRRKAAGYLEIGRAMRGEPGVPGIERLQERIAAELGDKPVDEGVVLPEAPAGRAVRPLVGIAVAASVALVALVGLQMTQSVDGTGAAPENAVAGAVEEAGYTVPQPVDEQLRQYYLSHGAASSSELGANGMNARLVTLRLSDEALAAGEDVEEEAVDDEAADETPTQP